MKHLDILAIIPARGDSKGIPRKNIRLLAGKPLIAYSIEHALCAEQVSRVVVSTDDPEIASVSKKYGAEVVQRPKQISGDKASSEQALLHVLDSLQNEENYEPELVVFLQATSPCRSPEDIDGAISKLLENNGDSCFSVCPEHFTGRWRTDADGIVLPTNFEVNKRPRRQDYGIEYLENGNIYVFKPELLRKTGARIGGKIILYAMNLLNSIQIDSLQDLGLAEQVLQVYGLNRHKNPDLSTLSKVSLLVLDFDGVMTNNMVLLGQDGQEAVFCNRGDGLGIAHLKEIGIKVFVLSTEKNPVVAARCRKLQIDCISGSDDKLSALKQIANRYSLDCEQIAYVGNDINDIECMNWTGVSIAPADAVPKILAVAKFITQQCGGAGVVRQVADWLIDAQEKI